MIIKKISFKNFKSFSSITKNQTLDKLDILSLIYGENNSGKSNVLKFIDLLFKRKVGLEDFITVSGQTVSAPVDSAPFWKGRITNDAFIFHKNNRTENISFEFELSFYHSEILRLANSKLFIKEFSLTGNSIDFKIKGQIKSLIDPYDSEIVLDSISLNKIAIYSNHLGKIKFFQGLKAASPLFGDSVSFENLMGLLNDCVLFLDHNRFVNKENEIDLETSLTPNNFKNWLHNLSLDPVRYSRYVEFLTFIKSNSITGNSGKVLTQFEPTFARKDREIDIFLKTNSERLPINSFGTGIMQILLILSMIYETKAKIILIEELELNLSPKSQQELLHILGTLIQKKIINQVIFTSHSDILSKTNGLSVFEVQLSNTGVSSINYKTNPSASFFNRNKAIDRQMASVVRKNGVKGPEWD